MGRKIFDGSGWFAINNDLFDVIMPSISPNAFRILCVAIRQTWGWVAEPGGDPRQRKQSDRISYSQFMEKAGIGSRHTVSKCIQECLDAGYLLRREVGRAKGTNRPLYAYSLNTNYELGSDIESKQSSPPEDEEEPIPNLGPGMSSSAEYTPATGAQSAPDLNFPGAEYTPATGALSAPVTGADSALPNNNKIKKKKASAASATRRLRMDVVVGGDRYFQAIEELVRFGVAYDTARKLAKTNNLKRVRAAIAEARQKGAKNPPGFAIHLLRSGSKIPEPVGGYEEELDEEIPVFM